MPPAAQGLFISVHSPSQRHNAEAPGSSIANKTTDKKGSFYENAFE